MKGLEGIETSAVTHPAVPGTGTDSIASRLMQLSQMKKGIIAPAIPAEGLKQEGRMLDKIRQKLGLPADTPETEALTALDARLAQKPGVPKALCAALGLAEAAAEDEVIAKVVSLTAPGNYVPRAEHDKTVDELGTYKAKERVAAAKSAGKITPAMETWAIEYAKRDPDSFDAFLKHAPVQTPFNAAPPPAAAADPANPAGGLTADELMVAKRTGRTPEEFAKEKKAVAEFEARASAIN
jgi:phage I-like protein